MRRVIYTMLVLVAAVHASAGPYRNAYLCGTMPWHRSFRDANLCTGNLMKSFTDIQVAPARGAGLVLQRTYNSNDDRLGPFGRGWTHAYDIRMEEAESINSDIPNPEGGQPLPKESRVVRTDFFGGKHVYKRDADGLYTPPPYMHDWTESNYDEVLDVGPGDVTYDIEKGLDGTIKHFTAIEDTRFCDYIEDRHGNRTSLDYDDGLLTSVTDPSERVLDFTWTNYGTQQNPVWRITQATAPLQTVTYDYYRSDDPERVLDPTGYDAKTGGEWYNLKSVTLDPSGLARTTTYTYTNEIDEDSSVECGLLASITDPIGNSVSYTYGMDEEHGNGGLLTGSVWVWRITEPGGADPTETVPERRDLIWQVGYTNPYGGGDRVVTVSQLDWESWKLETVNPVWLVWVSSDSSGHRRATGVGIHSMLSPTLEHLRHGLAYDDSNNVVHRSRYSFSQADAVRNADEVNQDDSYIFGRFGNVLYHYLGEYDEEAEETQLPPENRLYEKYTYYDESKYFQKSSYTDMNGNKTTFGYGATNAASGLRGNLVWVRDAGHQPDGPAFVYGYNSHGQKVEETNLNDVVTEYTYGDTWGNLTEVVQDPGGLDRTTTMEYDAAGRVVERIDPNGCTSAYLH